MKKAIVFVVMLALVPLMASQTAAIGNDEVVKMVKAGLSAEVVVGAIQSAPGNYIVTPDALIALANAGVPAAVIQAMQGKSKATTVPALNAAASPAPTAAPAATSNLPLPAETGVFLRRADRCEFLQKEEAAYNRSTGKGLGFYGITKIKMYYWLPGETSAVKVAADQPTVFVLHLPDADRKLELLLMEVKDGKRLLATEEQRLVFNHKVKRNQVAISTKVLGPNYLELTTNVPLAAGEYALMDQGDNKQAPKAWAFSVTK